MVDVSLLFGVLAASYSVVLAFLRHSTFEDKGIVDSIVDLIINLSPILVTLYWNRDGNFVFSLGISSLCLFLISRSYYKYVYGNKFKTMNLRGKVYIITGSNTGIGFETAVSLASMGGVVILACRSLEKASLAKLEIIKRTSCESINIIPLELDLCSLISVRDFATNFKKLNLPLHGLINNAGVMMHERSATTDGFETVFAANHIGHFLLTNLLLPYIEESRGRVVVLTSSLHKSATTFHFDDVMSIRQYSLFGTYSQAKLANILFAFELQRRMWTKGSRVTVYAVHPGLVRTEVTRHMSPLMQLLNNLLAPILLTLQKTPAQGAFSTIDAVTSPAWDGIGGKYIFHGKSVTCSKVARDLNAAKELWKLSEKLTGLA